jgi:SAM-dependent methyltransferase
MNRIATPRRLFLRLRHGGMRWLWYAMRDRVAPVHPHFLPEAHAVLRSQRGLEIGGPSRIFRNGGAIPVYRWVRNLDNINFAPETTWEHALSDGSPFQFHPQKPPGRQWLREAASLDGLASGAYDCVLSSYCLEHTANPLAALGEWHRIIKPRGHLLIVIPDPAHTFDHRRPITQLDHLRADRSAGVSEGDESHFAEVLELHDLALDPDAGSTESFHLRVRDNARQRCVHHHVFDVALLHAALRETGWSPLAVERFAPIHLGALAQKKTP